MITWTTNEADYPTGYKFLYVSKYGSNTNDGTKSAPLLTISQAVVVAQADAAYIAGEVVIVIGAGVWAENPSTSRNKRYIFKGEIGCVLDRGGLTPFYLEINETIENIEIINGNFKINRTEYAASGNFNFKNILSNGDIIISWLSHNRVYNININTCVIIGDFVTSTGPLDGTVAIIANVNISGSTMNRIVHNLTSNNLNASRIKIYYYIINSIFSKLIYNNELFPGLALGRAYYVSGSDYFCTTDNILQRDYNEGEINLLNTFRAAGLGNNAIHDDPLFNNEIIGDYSLSEISPCLLAGLNRSHIGRFNRGWPHYSFSEIFSTVVGAEYSTSYDSLGVLNQDVLVDLITGSWELRSGKNTGVVVSAFGNLGGPQRINGIEGIFEFSNDGTGLITAMPVWSDFLFAAYDDAKKYFEGDTVTDGAVKYICILDYPNESPFVEYPPASSPTYWEVSTIPTATNVVPNFLFRFGNSLAEVNTSDWKLMPFKGDFKVDENGKGSADPDYNAATGRYLTFSRYQFKIKLKNL